MISWRQKTIIRKRSEHTISRKDIDPDALKVLYRLNRSGFKAYLVGGGVRDLLIGRRPKDFDVSTDAHPQQIRKLFRNCWLIGRRFRLAHIRFGPKIIETSTFRRKPEPVDATDAEENSLYQHHDNTFGTAEEDALRRDFTVNGLFYDIDSFSVIDHVGGLRDLDRRLIRAIGDPDERFQEDPVRILRAIRFASRLDFQIEKRTLQALKRHVSQLAMAAAPRLFEEIVRLFAFRSGERAMRLAWEYGVLHVLMPELAAFLDESPQRQELLWRCLAAMDSCDETQECPSAPLAIATLFAPLIYSICEKNVAQKTPVIIHDVARDVLTPFAVRFRMPKRQQYEAVRMLDARRRFEDWQRGRFAKRKFVRQESFPPASLLYRFYRKTLEPGKQLDEPWWDLYREEIKRKPEIASEQETKRKPRRRSGRRPRRGPRRRPTN